MPEIRCPSTALIPCAGRATRLGNIACSKELMPMRQVLPDRRQPTGVDSLLDLSIQRCAGAGIQRAVIPMRMKKTDLATYLHQSSRFGVQLSPVPVSGTRSVLDSVGRALNAIRREHLLLVFPDILFSPADAIRQAARAYTASENDLLLALIPTDRPDKYDMIELEHDGRVREIHIKNPHAGNLRYGWAFAIWAPAFTEFCLRNLGQRASMTANDAHIGQLMRAWMAEGHSVHTIRFPDGMQLDLGTRDDLERAPVLFSAEPGERPS